MRKFKHKTLWMIAEQNNDFSYWDYVIESIDANYSRWSKAYPDLRVVRTIPPELIENSQDRQEVIDRDWISNAWKEYEECWTTNGYEEFREIIKKHVPQANKFTKKEVWDFFRNNWYNPTIQWNTYWFLKEHNLLSEDTQWETCEHESDWWVYMTLRKEWEEQKPPQSKCTKCKKFYRN